MMGRKERQFAPLIHVSLEELVPQDHFYRHLERTLDLSFVREFVQQTYAGGGRPSIDPVVFFKLQLVMFFEDIVRCENRILRVGRGRTTPGSCPGLSSTPACVPGNGRVRSQE
jgi:hypothetical protein